MQRIIPRTISAPVHYYGLQQYAKMMISTSEATPNSAITEKGTSKSTDEASSSCTLTNGNMNKLPENVDPFRMGYNIGVQNIQLETLRNKMDDSRELLKSQFAALRDTNRINTESIHSLHSEKTKQTNSIIEDQCHKMSVHIDSLSQRLTSNEEIVKDLIKHHFYTHEKHVDDRIENIKDTIKITSLILVMLNILVLYYLQVNTESSPSRDPAHDHLSDMYKQRPSEHTPNKK